MKDKSLKIARDLLVAALQNPNCPLSPDQDRFAEDILNAYKKIYKGVRIIENRTENEDEDELFATEFGVEYPDYMVDE